MRLQTSAPDPDGAGADEGRFDGDPVRDETGVDERDPPQPDLQDDPNLDEETR